MSEQLQSYFLSLSLSLSLFYQSIECLLQLLLVSLSILSLLRDVDNPKLSKLSNPFFFPLILLSPCPLLTCWSIDCSKNLIGVANSWPCWYFFFLADLTGSYQNNQIMTMTRKERRKRRKRRKKESITSLIGMKNRSPVCDVTCNESWLSGGNELEQK
jgi:hypothetical protein